MINLIRFLVFIFIIVLSLSLKASEASNWLKQEVDKILVAYQDPNLPNENRFLLIEQTINITFWRFGNRVLFRIVILSLDGVATSVRFCRSH